MVFGNVVKTIQAAAYNGARTVHICFVIVFFVKTVLIG